MREQLNLFTYIEIGSKEWKKERYYQLIEKYTFQELEKYMNSIFESKQEYDYWSYNVAIDICHSYYFEEFFKKYPKILFRKRKISYIDEF